MHAGCRTIRFGWSFDGRARKLSNESNRVVLVVSFSRLYLFEYLLSLELYSQQVWNTRDKLLKTGHLIHYMAVLRRLCSLITGSSINNKYHRQTFIFWHFTNILNDLRCIVVQFKFTRKKFKLLGWYYRIRKISATKLCGYWKIRKHVQYNDDHKKYVNFKQTRETRNFSTICNISKGTAGWEPRCHLLAVEPRRGRFREWGSMIPCA